VTKHVLVVEDDAPTRSFLVMALTDEGYVVSASSDGEDALERCAAIKPDLVVLDLGLPVVDGVEFLKRRREICPAPVIAMSAAHRSTELTGLSVAAFLAKPFDLHHLFRLVDEHVDGVGEGQRSGQRVH
jgi:DNA-binding response OmpR family regulator